MVGKHHFQKHDLWWLIGYPMYQLLGTLRHEGCHALVALAEGAQITHFVIWPTTQRGHVYFGYTAWSGHTDWLPIAAPFLGDLLTYLCLWFLCTQVGFKRHWVWTNLVILRLISPLLNSGYGYGLAVLRGGNDIAWLNQMLPPPVVHGYLILTLLLYLTGLIVLLPFPGGWPPLHRGAPAKRVFSETRRQ